MPFKNETFRAIFEATGTATLLVDGDTTILMVNQQCSLLFGYKKEDVEGQSWTRFVVPEHLEEMKKSHNLRRKDPIAAPESYEVKLIHASGEHRFVNLHVAMLPGSKISIISILDITKQKTAEAQLRESEGRFRRLFKEHVAIQLLIDPKTGKILDANPAAEKFYGWSRHELKQMTIQQINSLPPEKVNEEMKRAKTLQKNHFDFQHRLKNGETRYVEVFSSKVGEGDHVFLHSIIYDNTARKTAELKLKESEEKFRKAFIASPDSMIITRLRDGSFITINEGFTNMLGFTKEEIIGKSSYELNVWHNYTDREKLTKALKQNGKVNNFEVQFVKKDKSIIYGLVSAVIISLNNEPHILSITRDITERKKQEQTETELRRRFQDTMESISEGVVMFDQQMNYTYVNPQGATLLGKKVDELVGKNYYDLYPEAKGTVFEKACQKALRTKQSIELQDYYPYFDKWYTNKIFPTPEGIAIYFADVTDKIKNKELISTLTFAFEFSPVSIVITNSKGEIEIANKRFTEITQYAFADVEGKTPRIFHKGKLDVDAYNKMQHLLKEGTSWKGEFYNRKKDGSFFWEEVTISSLTDENGIISHYILISEDITQLRETRLQLKLLSRSVEQSPVSVMITDKEGYFTYVNPAFELTSGYSLDELKGQTPRVLKSGEHTEEFYTELWYTILSGKTWQGEFRNKRKNGELYWDHSIISPMTNSKNEITHFVAVQQDITKEKAMIEELVAAKEKAEESDRLKSAFLANMSHEIRTPMNGIFGFLGLLKEPNLDEESKTQYIEIVNKSGQRLMNTINDIIEISKLEAGQVTVQKSRFSLTGLLDDLVKFFQPEAEEKGLQLLSHIPNENIEIESDKSKLESVFTNLIKNAIKFTSKGKIEVKVEFGKGGLLVCVEDTGRGIPKSKQEKIFDRFVQGDTTLTRPYEGSGLGLTITKEYLQMLHAEISVESEEGKGSRFCVKFSNEDVNISEGNKKETTLSGKPIKMKEDKLVLIAEDDETSYQYLFIALHSANVNLLWAKDGVEAIELALNQPVDLVLMDAKMPNLNGYEATRRILQQKPGLPIIMQTAHALSGDEQKALDAGCVDYISKPIIKKLLLKKLAKYI